MKKMISKASALLLSIVLFLTLSAPFAVAETMVWKSASGSKYHSINNCGNMNPAKAKKITLTAAINTYGLERCSKCNAPKKSSSSSNESSSSSSAKKPSSIQADGTISLFAEADKSSTVLTKIPAGTKLSVLSQTNFFYRVSYNQQTGFVRKTDTK